MEWIIKAEEFDPDKVEWNGTRFLLGNGRIGVRGTLDEYGKDQCVAVNMAGVYDQVEGKWREPVNAPNPAYTYILVDGERYSLPDREPASHQEGLDFKKGIFFRKTLFITPRGRVEISSERFCHYSYGDLICMTYHVRADFNCEIEIYTGIDNEIWDLNGPHLKNTRLYEEDGVLISANETQEKKIPVATGEKIHVDFRCERQVIQENDKILHRLTFIAEKDREYSFYKFMTVEKGPGAAERAKSAALDFYEKGYEMLYLDQVSVWGKSWDESRVEIKGNEEDETRINYCIYQLKILAPRFDKDLSVPARGLSGQTYKGAVFWDTEMFILDYFLYSDPEVAKTLIEYRIKGLKGAKIKAKEYGYEGAFYAWESQEDGFDACSDYNVTDVFSGRDMRTFFRDKQVHISAAVVFGIIKYIKATGDTTILKDGADELIIECAKFYDSLLLKKVHSDKYEIHDVIGPDEYHERVNNNLYTNLMAKMVFEEAIKLLEEGELRSRFEDDYKHIFIPTPNKDGVIPQFDGYFSLEDATLDEVRSRILNPKEYWGGAYGVASWTQVIKQADVVTALELFAQEYDRDILKANLDYYQSRTEHGSSLSACMYGLLHLQLDEVEKAYPFFEKTSTADLVQGGKQWAGNIYIGGSHPAAAGGAYQMMIYGFLGLSFEDGKISMKPRLPKDWEEVKIRLKYRGNVYEIIEEGKRGTCTKIG
ncbi:MAG: glycoside hydrolase family 65 protein [Pseudobutyrivibrio sp.]|nr:glycoside hydrolase family 65 protein [Pseudobutyrivibrio sp.]